jgi:signal transduction histidine kinase
VDLETIFEEIRQDWHGVLAAQGRALRLDQRPGTTGSVSGPAARQVLAVLLDNATRHGRATVTVTARGAQEAIAVDVADEGTGIDPGTDPFQRRSATANGHGIGLSLARSLAEAEGGRLHLSRPAPPVFTLLLSRAEHRTPPDPGQHTAPAD